MLHSTLNEMFKDPTFWKKTVKEKDLVIAYFYANWSDPCRKLNPVWEKIQREHSANATFLNINVEIYPGITKELKIKNIPTILYISKGEIWEKQIKFHTEMVIELTIKKIHESHICFQN